MPIENINIENDIGISGGIKCAYCGEMFGLDIDKHYDDKHSALIKTISNMEEARRKRISKQED